MKNLQSLTSQIKKQEKLYNKLYKDLKFQIQSLTSDGRKTLVLQNESQNAYIILKCLESCLNDVQENESHIDYLIK
tara:strand:+ start:149 stop:376 length:228 start_codon:yes stop_codon:yes gene_type:complete